VAPYQHSPPDYALPPESDGAFATLADKLRAQHDDATSGFKLLDGNEESLRWRLALIDSAKYSVDTQYYLWYGDAVGRLLASRLIDAASRGVRVRLLVDDLNTVLATAKTVTMRDRVVAWLDAHPNIEIRLFNPWSKRDVISRVGESVAQMQRVNQRMHNKSLIVDNQAVIIGGRNIGDEYFGLNDEFNFHDLDVLAVGPAAGQASEVFDNYWNSEWVLPVSALKLETSRAVQEQGRAQLEQELKELTALARFPLARASRSDEIASLAREMHTGTSRVASDLLDGDEVKRVMSDAVGAAMAATRHELLVANAYIIPSDKGIHLLEELRDRGASVKILTNSLASHDVAAVNSHYKAWRRPILESGAQLFEMRHDPAIAAQICNTAPTSGRFVGLHSKAMVVDRENVYIGSMNYDPRSASLNTEMGMFIESPGLGEALARLIERDMLPVNSWQVMLDEDDSLSWANDTQRVNRQPARHWWQRVEDLFFMGFPKELY
jgi:putative cardiolipin synthase